MTVADPGDSLQRALNQPVLLVDHDPRWAAVFDAERARLVRLFPSTFIEISHIGSTPIAGLRTKPIVDLLAGVRSMDEAHALAAPLCEHGYALAGDLNTKLTDRQFFLRHADGQRTHHLHVVVHGSASWREHVAFCRLLRDDPELRARYQQLKTDLSTRYATDRDAYTEGKTVFVHAALQRLDPSATTGP